MLRLSTAFRNRPSAARTARIASACVVLVAALSRPALADTPGVPPINPIGPMPSSGTATGGLTIPAPAPALTSAPLSAGLGPVALPDRPVYAPFVWPAARATLTPDHEFTIQSQALANATTAIEFEKKKLDASKALADDRAKSASRDSLLGLAASALWPLVVLVILLVFRTTIEKIALTRKWSFSGAGVSLSVDGQLSMIPDTATVQAANAAATYIQTNAPAPQIPPQLPVMLLAHTMARASADPRLRDSAITLDTYFARAASAMTASQTALLKRAAQGPVGASEVGSMYAVAQSQGYPLPKSAWLRYLTGFDFLRETGGRLNLNKQYVITDLGRQYLLWAAAHGLNDETLRAQGRGA